MNNDHVKQIIQGIGVMTELWMITYNGFKSQGLNDTDALSHTKAFMSIMVTGLFNNSNNGETEE